LKICNQFVKRVKKYGVPDKNNQRVVDLILARGQSILEKANKGPNENFGAASIIWDQIIEI